MVEEGISRNTIQKDELVNSDLFISVSENSCKLGLAKLATGIVVMEDFNTAHQQDILKLLSLSKSDLESCKNIYLMTHSEVYTLVPSELYDPENQKNYLLQLTDIDNDKPVKSDFIKELDSYIIYQPSSLTMEVLNDLPLQTQLIHHAAVFIRYQLLFNNLATAKVFIHFEANCFNCVVVNQKKLLYSNSQGFVTASDAIFYILSIYQHLNLDANTIELIISGKIMPYSELHSILLRFIRNVEWFKVAKDIKITQSEGLTSYHLYADLIQLFACVS